MKTIKSNKIRQTKKALIKALEGSLGIVTTACRKVGIDRSTFYEYYNKDPKFAFEVDSIKDLACDFVESKLFENIKDKKETSIIFYLKTKGKHRGYIERQEIQHQEVDEFDGMTRAEIKAEIQRYEKQKK